MKKSKHNKNVASYFERNWKLLEKWCYAGETLCIHYAYYDKNTKNFKDAVYKMNDLIGELLELEKDKYKKKKKRNKKYYFFFRYGRPVLLFTPTTILSGLSHGEPLLGVLLEKK